MISLRLAGFSRVVSTRTLATILVGCQLVRNDFLLAFNLYARNYATTEIWGFLGRDWFHSYVINSVNFSIFFPRDFGLAFMQQQLLELLRLFLWNNFCIYASPLSLLVSETQSVMN